MSDFNKSIEGTTLFFAPEVSITVGNAPQLRDEISESLDGISDVVFDLADVEYVSSAGLRVILATQKALGDRGTVHVKNASEEVRSVLQVTRLATFVEIE